VARDLREADQRVALPDGIDQHAGPESAAVLLDAPALALELAGARGGRQRERRLAGRPILGRVDLREMPAANLRLGIALDALGARVPGGHVALRIEHVDRAVANAAQEPRKARLATIGVQRRRSVAQSLIWRACSHVMHLERVSALEEKERVT